MSELGLFDDKKPVPPVENSGTVETNPTNAVAAWLPSLSLSLTSWKDSSSKAVAALSTIKSIESDEQDEAAEKILVKVRATYDKISKERLSATEKLDNLKKFLMIPEKAISTDAKASDSEYNRVRNLRNVWYQKKLDQAKEAEKQAAVKKAKDDEIIRLKGLIETTTHDGIVQLTYDTDKSLDKFIAGITLENYDSKILQFNVTPKLKRELYESWIFPAYNTNILTPEDYKALIDKVQEKYTYDFLNGQYVTAVTPIIQLQKDKLPALKEQLIEMEELKKTNAAEADRLQKEKEAQAEADRLQKEKDLQAQKEEHARSVKEAEDNAKLSATFEQQMAVQQTAFVGKGTRTKQVATITGPKEKIVEILSEVLYDLFTSETPPEIIKWDTKAGAYKYDENGRPIYADWVEQILEMWANKCNKPIAGIEVKEQVITTAKAKKA